MIIHELILGGVGLLTTTASSLVTWKLAKKKYKAEVDNTVIENLKKSLDFYEELSNHNKEQLKALTEENKELRKELDDVRKQLQELTTNLYLDEAYKNRVRTRRIQLKNQEGNAKNSSRLDTTEKSNRGRRKSPNKGGDTPATEQ